MVNPNACQHCNHKQHPDGGWCYMFREQPKGICAQHTSGSNLHRLLTGVPTGKLIAVLVNQGVEAAAEAAPEMKPFYHDGKLVGYQERSRVEKMFCLPAGEN